MGLGRKTDAEAKAYGGRMMTEITVRLTDDVRNVIESLPRGEKADYIRAAILEKSARSK